MKNNRTRRLLKASKMSGKLQGISALNTCPLANKRCKKRYTANDPKAVCSYCYSVDMLSTVRQSCVDRWTLNGQVLSARPLKDSEIPYFEEEYVRFNAHGELTGITHFRNLLKIANELPRKWFTLWTKEIKIVRHAFESAQQPKNLRLIYSNPHLDTIIAPPLGFDGSFNVLTTEYLKARNMTPFCDLLRCRSCMNCYGDRVTTRIITERLKKNKHHNQPDWSV